jgi:hypothetical protein
VPGLVVGLGTVNAQEIKGDDKAGERKNRHVRRLPWHQGLPGGDLVGFITSIVSNWAASSKDCNRCTGEF